MRDRRLSNDYASLIFEYCEEHADFTIKQFDASDAIARSGYSQVKFFMTIRKCLLCSFQVSSWQPVKSGIPQGSVLGPVLFLIYINTIPDKMVSKIYLFADNAKLYRQIEDKSDVTRIHEDLQSLEIWSSQGFLSFNIDKCVHMTIGTKKLDMKRIYKIIGENIKEVQLEKYLGIWLDNKLTFETHITKKANKANGMIAVIKKSFTKVTKQVFLNIYKCLIRPHLELANSIWHPRLIKHQKILENVQRRATRLVN